MSAMRRLGGWIPLLCLVTFLVGCASGKGQAPVEDRGTSTGRNVPVTAQPAALPTQVPVVKVLPGAENAGKPGYYTVKQGDTLIRIGLENGQNWRDIVRWNSVENPNLIEVGQVLRVVPPATAVPDGVVVRPVVVPVVTAGTSTVANGSGTVARPASNATTTTVATAPAASGEDDVAWIWPGAGPLLAGFDEVKNKGLDIGGKAGDPVLAAADGRVVYAGAGLRGYGNLVIIKHNNTYLTAYAHNQSLLVKEEQAVRRGQKIAEMGNTDADKVKLHFEIRRQGKPVDPARYLPARQ